LADVYRYGDDALPLIRRARRQRFHAAQGAEVENSKHKAAEQGGKADAKVATKGYEEMGKASSCEPLTLSRVNRAP
jgi:hypothetical protein